MSHPAIVLQLALVDRRAYTAAYPDCGPMLTDCNQDGVVDLFDIDALSALLAGG